MLLLKNYPKYPTITHIVYSPPVSVNESEPGFNEEEILSPLQKNVVFLDVRDNRLTKSVITTKIPLTPTVG